MFVKLSTHAGVLAALAGYDEHGLTAKVGQVMVAGELRVGLAGANGTQGVQHVVARIGAARRSGDHRPMGVMCAGAAQAVGHIAEIQVGMA
ncbi:hypothetical protein, partial [Mycobacterium sp.]|uniref:hypothetical protein n=1 Tax=Mycobacterium sp. TaxID=1785 RepID=UPI00262A8A99